MRFRSPSPSSLALLVAGFLASAAGAATHQNEEIGYRIRLPAEYVLQRKGYAVNGELLESMNPYLLETFTCKKPLREKKGSTYTRRMYTYFFPDRSAADLAKERAEQEKAEAEGDEKTIALQAERRIFRSFEEYATENIRGFYFSAEKELKVAGFPATTYEMSLEKLTNTPQRFVACAYAIPGGEFAVLFTCTEEHFKECRAGFHKSLSSFKVLNEEEGLRAPTWTVVKVDVDKVLEERDERELSVEERLKRRNTERDEVFEKAIESLEKGWRHLRDDDFLVVFNTDSREGKKALKHAQRLKQWLSDEYGVLGEGVVPATIFRLAEMGPGRGGRASGALGRDGDVRTFQVYFNERANDPKVAYIDFTRSYVPFWFEERNDALWRYLPAWIRIGVFDVLENAYVSGSGLKFDEDRSDLRSLGYLFRAEEEYEDQKNKEGLPIPIVSTRDVVGPAAVDLRRGPTAVLLKIQSVSLFRYLFDGPGSKKRKTENVLRHYLGHLVELTEAADRRAKEEEARKKAEEEAKKELTEEQQLEAEDEEYRQRRENGGAKVERDILERAFALTFGDWSEEDWKGIDRSWKSYAKKLADL